MKLKLVYYFYAPADRYFPTIYKYHFACLKRYMNMFDDILIIIAVDDVNNKELINYIENIFINFGVYKNISFKIYKNDPYLREAIAFKNEIVDTLDTSEYLTFFGHSKGFTNIFSGALKYWVLSMYYFALEDIEEVKRKMIDGLCVFYGFAIMRGSCVSSKYKWHFPGSMFWINCPHLNMEYGNQIPKLGNRSYVEMFPGSVIDLPLNNNEIHKVDWPGQYFLEGNYNFYESCPYLLSLAFSKDDYNKFVNFVDEIDSHIAEYEF